MPAYKPLKYSEVIRILKNLGFVYVCSEGSHETWVGDHDSLKWAVTVPFHGKGREIRTGTLGSIIRQTGYIKEEFYAAAGKRAAKQIVAGTWKE
jgi:predicted RNA binding protein YcfA (HicA-like mRNA interferase family)